MLEAQLPNVEVTERALAINALLSALKLQVGSRASWTASVALHCLSQQHETRQGWLAPPARPCCSSHLPPCLLACLARLCRAVPVRPCLCRSLSTPQTPSSHIYKANAQGDTARCALIPLLLQQSRGS